MVTIEDVARLAGVSTATVSRVVNGASHVSEKRRQLVQEAIEELGYTPSVAGRLLKRARTRTLFVCFGILIPEFISGVTDEAKAIGYDTLFSYSPYYLSDWSSLQVLRSGLVDGVIFQDVLLSDELAQSIADNYHIVGCNSFSADDGRALGSISINNELVMADLTRHLLQKGRRRIAAVGIARNGSEPAFSVSRESGVRSAMAAAGMPWGALTVLKGDGSYAAGEEAARQLMAEYPDTDAIICFNDYMAIGCISELFRMGKRVPEDVYVTGFDNLEITACCRPTVTTVSQPFYEMGRRAVLSLVAQLEESALPPDAVMNGTLVLRESTGD